MALNKQVGVSKGAFTADIDSFFCCHHWYGPYLFKSFGLKQIEIIVNFMSLYHFNDLSVAGGKLDLSQC